MDQGIRTEITRKIEKGETVELKFAYADSELLMFINSIMAKELAKMDHIYLLNSMITILREVIVNAMKANAKRVFFIKNNLDIKDKAGYKEGMSRFKEEVIGEFDAIEKDLKNSDYYVKIDFSRNDQNLHVVINNNTPILTEELERINLRIGKALKYNDFSDAYDEIEDDTEGAGLGIVLTILFLKNMGIDPKTFSITTNGNETKTTLFVPRDLRPPQITSKIRDEIVADVEGIPTFPENIVRLLNLCNSPDSTMEIIADKILMDPALAADVIKLSNSAGFVPGKRIETVLEAVKTIGLKNVNAILVASNARSILEKRYASFEEIWRHLTKTAFYARNIGLMLKKPGLADNAFMAGLLHDLGKIVLLATNLQLVEKVAETIKNRRIITSTVMEEISIGISHSQIGELIAKKWNFPDYLVEAIRYHHAPHSSSEQHRDLAFSVYLANMLCGIDDKKYYYFYCDEIVLERFGILEEEKFRDLHGKLKGKWELNLEE
ncbi:MAG: HD family phosphohydrolase [Spirochaetae bacterium HGW-Spirochaetae-1]|jgi:HD-like signal output (HDOD) protein|nr:MAG: HD family phosphohydrolase [Spirochaetae bacterium HGW-Spirochaetae-1]